MDYRYEIHMFEPSCDGIRCRLTVFYSYNTFHATKVFHPFELERIESFNQEMLLGFRDRIVDGLWREMGAAIARHFMKMKHETFYYGRPILPDN